MKYLKLFLISIAILSLHFYCTAQSSTYIDDKGIMRWAESNEEVCVFGTNYTSPFSYWKDRQAIGADQKKAIDEDVYHMARLGFDGYRVPVWDVHISDTLGNLVNNEHLDLYDYLQYKLKERGIKMYVTPLILFTDVESGFASHYGGKKACLSDTAVFPIMEKYLTQFMNHINPYTGIAYKNDPDIIAFEIINEPAHWGAPDLVTTYINRMYDAIRASGCDKPLLYNMTTCADFIDEVFASKAEGGSFQWYPSGLTCNHYLKGNMLPHVDRYHIPFGDKLEELNMPKFVYEFSPSDIGASGHLYPAMARSFREAGFQFAAQFAYDPMHAAYCNIDFKTHFLNLAYTPKKAIGMMIASEVFHAVPLNKSYGRYPKNNQFGSFSLNSEKDLAEIVSEGKFIYTNNTETSPANTQNLKQIAGTGNSPLVNYSGNGAYFLDKLEAGVWRLEVMPDAFWVSNPFFVPYIDRETAVTVSRFQNMSISLPDLGKDFDITGLNDGNDTDEQAKDNSFKISPGVYMLAKNGKTSEFKGDDFINNLQLKEFHIPTRKLNKIYVLHNPPVEVNAGEKLQLTAQVISPEKPELVELVILKLGGADVIEMEARDEYAFVADIPDDLLIDNGVIRYYISVKQNKHHVLFPGAEEGIHVLKRRIYQGDNRLDNAMPYEISLVEPAQPIVLFDAGYDWENITKMKRNIDLPRSPSKIPGKPFINLGVKNLNIPENNFSIEFWCRDRVESRLSSVKDKSRLVIYGKAIYNKPCKVQVSLLLKDGSAYGGMVNVGESTGEYALNLNDFKLEKSMLLPRPYPKFLDYWFKPSESNSFSLEELEKIQLSIGSGIPENEYNKQHGVALGWVELQ